MENFLYDIAISFAEEDRNAALALTLALEMTGYEKVYYYPNYTAVTFGHELKKRLMELYENEARYAVILLSEYYLQKEYTQIELQAIQSRASQASSVYILPVILPSFKKELLDQESFRALKQLAYLEWKYDPKAVANAIKDKLGKPLNQEKHEKSTGLNLLKIFDELHVTNMDRNDSNVNTKNSNYNISL